MIALYLLAAHFVGDYLFQTRWQAAGKFGSSLRAFELRARHVTTYALCFVPIAVVYSSSAWYAADFMVWLWILHFATDARRYYSTIGDRIAWLAEPKTEGHIVDFGRSKIWRREALPPSPWEPLPILIDQTLHFVQIAVLAGLLLR